jgi:hypothetical protein
MTTMVCEENGDFALDHSKPQYHQSLSVLSRYEKDQSYPLESLGGGAELGVHTAMETQKRTNLPSDANMSYPNNFLQSLLIIALYLAMFLVALDMVSSRPGKCIQAGYLCKILARLATYKQILTLVHRV